VQWDSIVTHPIDFGYGVSSPLRALTLGENTTSSSGRRFHRKERRPDFTLSMLGMKVNPAFLYGGLHRNGGVAFFLLALACLAGVLKAVNKCEKWNARPSLPPPLV
jgi:hypothetical protein